MGSWRRGPSPLTDKRAQYLRLMQQRTSNAEACRIVGVNRKTGTRWKRGRRLARSAWGQGYATEAARAASRDGFERVGLQEIVSFTSAINLRSRRVMESLGMSRSEVGDFEHPSVPAGHPLRHHVLYRLPKPDPFAARGQSLSQIAGEGRSQVRTSATTTPTLSRAPLDSACSMSASATTPTSVAPSINDRMSLSATSLNRPSVHKRKRSPATTL